MSAITEALYNCLANDYTLTAMLALSATGAPAIYTPDLAPIDGPMPYIVSAGEGVSSPFDTKTTRGWRVWRDIRCFAPKDGSVVLVEQIAERVRWLLHRKPLTITGYDVWVADVTGPTPTGEDDAYGRVLTLRMIMQEVAVMP
jgi:hypothetical protein